MEFFRVMHDEFSKGVFDVIKLLLVTLVKRNWTKSENRRQKLYADGHNPVKLGNVCPILKKDPN